MTAHASASAPKVVHGSKATHGLTPVRDANSFRDPFAHYMYVLSCGDGSLYTGYATDVGARLAAHQAGRGAKYTKSHEPVELVAQARFYSKERAMSAEAHFKRLSRAEKDRLLGMTEGSGTPRASGTSEAAETSDGFADVLRRELPGFGDDTAREFVCRELATHVDPGYRSFMAGLLPTVDSRRIVGVRTPDLRRIAREVGRRNDAETYLQALPHRLFEENQAHAFLLGRERDYDRALARYQAFLPYIDNWATCDQTPVKILATRPDETYGLVVDWLASGRCYIARFGIGVLMHLYLGELFEPAQLALVAGTHLSADADGGAPTKDDVYYLNMMRAWYFAEALAQQQDAALPYFERREPEPAGTSQSPDIRTDGVCLDEWTRRKAIQKAIESRRIPAELKGYLRSCR